MKAKSDVTLNVLFERAIVVSLALAFGVFLADMLTPLGVASGVPYSLTVLVALQSRHRNYAIWFAVLCGLLTILAVFLGPGRGGSELWKVLTNRTLALLMVSITLTLGLMKRRAEERRNAAEQETRRHLTDLAHMERVKAAGELASGLAHELNQPLAAISLQAETCSTLVERKASSREKLVETLNEISEQSQRAAMIIRGFRSLVRKEDSQRSEFSLLDLVRETVSLLESQIRNAESAVRIVIPPTFFIVADRIQLQQVLMNLLKNAIESIQDCNREHRLTVVTATIENDSSVLVRVIDSGCGLQDRDPEILFERFYSSKGGGMGLGLAISRSIIEYHGGGIWAEPNELGGLTVSFELPIDRELTSDDVARSYSI